MLRLKLKYKLKLKRNKNLIKITKTHSNETMGIWINPYINQYINNTKKTLILYGLLHLFLRRPWAGFTQNITKNHLFTNILLNIIFYVLLKRERRRFGWVNGGIFIFLSFLVNKFAPCSGFTSFCFNKITGNLNRIDSFIRGRYTYKPTYTQNWSFRAY